MSTSAGSSVAPDNWDQHWTDLAAPSTINPGQRYRRMLVLDALNLDDTDGPVRLLDIGSGLGDLAHDALSKYPNVDFTGIDQSAAGVQIASRRAPTARFLVRDLLSPDQTAGEIESWATHAVCSEVLEHVDHPEELLRNVRPLLAPGCKLVVTVPGGPMSEFDRHIGHRRHYTPAMLRSTLLAAGFTVERAAGAGFPFFNLYRLTVIARGKRLIEDVAKEDTASMPLLTRVGMQAFGAVLRPSINSKRSGWQMVAIARK